MALEEVVRLGLAALKVKERRAREREQKERLSRCRQGLGEEFGREQMLALEDAIRTIDSVERAGEKRRWEEIEKCLRMEVFPPRWMPEEEEE